MSDIKTRSALEAFVDSQLPDGTGSIAAADVRAVLDSIVRSATLKIDSGEVEHIVINMSTSTPPGSPSNGDAYVVNEGATGDWAGQQDNVAIWDANESPAAWNFVAVTDGMVVWNLADDKAYRWDAGISPQAWVEEASGAANTFSGFRAIQTSAQSVDTSEVMSLDSVSGSNDAFNEGVDIGDLLTDDFFTVPAGLNGSYADFTAGMETASDQGIFVLRIERSTDSGSSWSEIAQIGTGDGYFGISNPRTGPVKLSSGDLWRVQVTSSATVNTTGDRRCFFAMTVLGS